MVLAQVADIGEVAKAGGLSIVESGILGSLLILSVVINVVLVRLLLRTQEQRVSDRESDTKRLEDVNKRLEGLHSTTLSALDGTAKAVEGLEHVYSSTNTTLQTMQTSLDTVVGQALKTIQVTSQGRHSSSRLSPPDGTPSVRGR